ncbi:MAG: biosynthetic arginine decarboxylase [Gammaproteobacteria bacterium]|jgi:arginine decarboxylase|nr:biosynthetic arginine decarboxylase [Gammaproteobacteria bacterium]
MSLDTDSAVQSYGIARWGAGYFAIGDGGRLVAHPKPGADGTVDLYRLAHDVRAAGLSWPVLVRFTDILRDRVAGLRGAFARAFAELDFQGRYTAVYPIKVNQQRSVVEQILAGGDGGVGLEAGSKPELMAVLALSPPGGVVVCNGYKDREYLRLALIGRALGHRVYVVVEKPSELELALAEAATLGVEPLFGVRVRLASSAAGKWQNSGGEKAKFGLSAAQVLALVERLRAAGRLDCLRLLHSHIGSQIPNLRDIRRGVGEVARFFQELRRLGAPVDVVDVGGGLGIDYEGTGSRHYCSINYSLDGYAREVVKALGRVCAEHGLPHPDVFTESGRALTAHHAVLITNVIDREPAPAGVEAPALTADAPEVLHTLAALTRAAAHASPLETYQEARHAIDEARDLFERGELRLEDRALAEQMYYAVCHRLRPRLLSSSRRQRELLDELHEQLAERVFCNFSLFQSMPDVWAIDQVFPVVPLHRLDEPTTSAAVLHDLTCDSDGCIDQYVDQDGVEATLPLHAPRPGEDYLIGIFLVGAYQEILGDMHNLFGDTDAVNVELDAAGGYRLTQPERGDSVDELLRYVHFDPEQMLRAYREKLRAAPIAARTADQFYDELKAGLYGYTYLED